MGPDPGLPEADHRQRRPRDDRGRERPSYLLGMRYLTASDTTYIAEYYRNGTGYSEEEARQFYQLVDTAFSTNDPALIQRAQSLAQGSYGRPNPGRDYFYFRAQQKDALGIVYFAPALTAIVEPAGPQLPAHARAAVQRDYESRVARAPVPSAGRHRHGFR